MKRGSILWFVANLTLTLIVLDLIGSHGLSVPPNGWDYKDLLTIILTALTALLAALAIFIGILQPVRKGPRQHRRDRAGAAAGGRRAAFSAPEIAPAASDMLPVSASARGLVV
jgi:hypothetical protein